jgi:hypothetical protein
LWLIPVSSPSLILFVAPFPSMELFFSHHDAQRILEDKMRNLSADVAARDAKLTQASAALSALEASLRAERDKVCLFSLHLWVMSLHASRPPPPLH